MLIAEAPLASWKLKVIQQLMMSISPTSKRVEIFFSFRRRHTRCGRDWSSDVCSSDLHVDGAVHVALRVHVDAAAGCSEYAAVVFDALRDVDGPVDVVEPSQPSGPTGRRRTASGA